MLADELDYVIGVDPHRDTHALAVVDVRSGGVVFEATAVADGEGYESVLRLANQHALGRRAFAVEGTGSFGAVSPDFSSAMKSGCSRSAGCDGSGSPARATHSMRSEPLAACSAKRGQPGHARAASGKRYEH